MSRAAHRDARDAKGGARTVDRLAVLCSGLWRLTKHTAQAGFRYRVTGLAAEAAFFALLSLPPLVLGLIGTLGYVGQVLDPYIVDRVRSTVLSTAHTVLTDSAVRSVVEPLLDDVLRGARGDILSVSFVISLWSGSRAMNVYVDTITISYGLNGIRGVVRTRALSFLLYVLGLIVGVVTIPLLIVGPQLARAALPVPTELVTVLYWPVLVVGCVFFLTCLYSVAVPARTPWWRDMPGAILALAIWIIGSGALRLYLAVSLTGLSIYGSLAAPIAVLAWLYVTALAVLIGAMLNASVDQLWPSAATAKAREARRQATQPIRIGSTSLRSPRDE